jgi:serine/tyrosine/threonine adenylyltransferase
MTALRPERAILELDGRFHQAVEPAAFPQHVLRFRNDRWAGRVGLGDLSEADWLDHFARFRPIGGSLEQPTALAYHGHQFGVYNPQLGDGRGFLFAQLRDDAGRLLDLGTKGSGQTPWSRQGDGRLTLKGGVREVLAASMLESLGVYTSKAFSVVETGEALHRGDEPSPTRSCVLVRLSHSHVRFGTFQRLAYHDDADGIARLVDYCIRHFFPHAAGPDTAASASEMFAATLEATADLAASWMAAGFVHGVLNTDNMVVTGESFDYGPWRFLPLSDPNFTAAYFDQQGLYRFGRQPAVAAWNLSQLGACLTLVCLPERLEPHLEGFARVYQQAFRDRMFAMLGLSPSASLDEDNQALQSFFAWIGSSKAIWPQTFFDWFGGGASEARALRSPQAKLYAGPEFETVRADLLRRAPDLPDRLAHPHFAADSPPFLLIEDVEAIWSPIAERDDWSRFEEALRRIDVQRQALDLRSGEPGF